MMASLSRIHIGRERRIPNRNHSLPNFGSAYPSGVRMTYQGSVPIDEFEPAGGVSAPYAGFWRRLAAWTIDGMAMEGLYVWFRIFGLGSSFIVLLTVAYFAFFYAGGWQATPGQRLVGIFVTTKDGERLTTGRAWARA